MVVHRPQKPKSELERLAEDLKFVNPYVDRAFTVAGGVDERSKYRTLAAVIKEIVGEERWKSQSHPAFRDTLRQAIDEFVPEYFTGREAEDSLDIGRSNLWKGKQERLCAAILYGFNDSEVLKLQGISENTDKVLTFRNDYRPAVLQIAGLEAVAESSEIRMMRVIRDDIARALLKLRDEVVAARLRISSVQLVDDEKYLVSRPDLMSRLRTTIGLGSSRLVWIHGDPGVGKSILVRSLLQESGVDTVWVDCAIDPTDSRKLHRQLVSVLQAHGVEISRNDDEVRLQFWELLKKRNIGSYVVIENHEADTLPELAMPAELSSMVIIVSRRPPPKHVPSNYILKIPDLDEEECFDLIRHHLPNASDEDCAQLRDKLYSRAILLDQACRTMRALNKSISSYLSDIDKPGEFIKFIDGASDEFNRSVGAHYRYLLQQIIEIYPKAATIMAFGGYLHDTPIPFLFYIWESNNKPPIEFEPIHEADTARYELRYDPPSGGTSYGIKSWKVDKFDLSQVKPSTYVEVENSLKLLSNFGLVDIHSGSKLGWLFPDDRGLSIHELTAHVFDALIRSDDEGLWVARHLHFGLRMVEALMGSVMGYEPDGSEG
ncbi:hypothetical protein NWFMUON74_56420 [Nocardia wallacei]|uniref:ORC1/DEAH AAA+ ATPase domain-containing protein n=2 Tax=Nocardia wallacei TaxID=480035 RepID=A0A7G1KRT8_9NOCA|nr:hypothetical protein NWFMUON74_56420 [Nocardia wallacei]